MLSILASAIGFIVIESMAMETFPNEVLYDNHIVALFGILAYFGTLGLGYYIGYSTREQ